MTSAIVRLCLFGAGFTILLMLLAPITRRCKAFCDALDASGKSFMDLIPSDQRPGTHFMHVCSKGGVLGLLFIPVLAVALPVNIQLLADAFSVGILDHSGAALFPVTLFSASLVVTDLDLFATLLAANFLVLGSVLAHAHAARWPWLCVALVALALIALGGFEIFATGSRGYYTALSAGRDPLIHALFSGLQGFVCAACEVLAGYYAIHEAILPLCRGVLCTVAVLLRALRPLGRLVHEALMEPLERLDSVTARAVIGLGSTKRSAPHAQNP